MADRVRVAALRLGTRYAVALPIVNRDLAACERMVEKLDREFDRGEPGSCCKPVIEHMDHYPPACDHLLRLWAARDYRNLAKCKAPLDSYPCNCDGSGEFHSNNGRGGVNIGVCFRCSGKGYQTLADRTRNSNYDRYYRRIYA